MKNDGGQVVCGGRQKRKELHMFMTWCLGSGERRIMNELSRTLFSILANRVCFCWRTATTCVYVTCLGWRQEGEPSGWFNTYYHSYSRLCHLCFHLVGDAAVAVITRVFSRGINISLSDNAHCASLRVASL